VDPRTRPPGIHFTAWTYNGLGQTVTLTAYNGNISSAQVTEYRYEDDEDASLATMTIYPDGDASSDNVQQTYHLDGSLATMTDQRGVVHTYAYNDRRQLAADQISDLGGSGADPLIESITRQYDELGRLTHITSHGNPTSDPTDATDIENQIKYEYSEIGKPLYNYQSHQGATTGTTPRVIHVFDSTTNGTVYDDGLRFIADKTPSNGVLWLTYGAADAIDDRLNRPSLLRFVYSGAQHVQYRYSGAGRLVEVSCQDSNLKLRNEGRITSVFTAAQSGS